MSMQKSEKGTKKFTEQEKLAILKEAKEKGLKLTLAKYDLYPATFYYWKRNYESLGESGLSHKKKSDDKRLEHLIEENNKLKILLAEKELENKYPGVSFKKVRRGWKKLKWPEQ